MPIRIKTDLEFGSIWYIINDPEQTPYVLVGIVLFPGNQFRFRLGFMGDTIEVFDFEVSNIPKEIEAENDLEL